LRHLQEGKREQRGLEGEISYLIYADVLSPVSSTPVPVAVAMAVYYEGIPSVQCF
jgi:hypothetical protein